MVISPEVMWHQQSASWTFAIDVASNPFFLHNLKNSSANFTQFLFG
jgi:hypothetical protein